MYDQIVYLKCQSSLKSLGHIPMGWFVRLLLTSSNLTNFARNNSTLLLIFGYDKIDTLRERLVEKIQEFIVNYLSNYDSCERNAIKNMNNFFFQLRSPCRLCIFIYVLTQWGLRPFLGPRPKTRPLEKIYPLKVLSWGAGSPVSRPREISWIHEYQKLPWGVWQYGGSLYIPLTRSR